MLSRSRSSLNSDEKDFKGDGKSTRGVHKLSPNLGQKHPTFTSHLQGGQAKNTGGGNNNPHVISVQKSNIQSNVIYLPKEYNPTASLVSFESRQGFIAKTFHVDVTTKSNQEIEEHLNEEGNTKTIDSLDSINKIKTQEFVHEDTDTENSFTNKIFSENFEASFKKDVVKLSKTFNLKSHSFPSTSDYRSKSNIGAENFMKIRKRVEIQSNCNYKQIVATCRMRELQILGCLIVEIFLSKQIRAQGIISNLDFNERLKLCVTIVKYHFEQLPRCVKYAVILLFQLDTNNFDGNIRYNSITDIGLPPPSAHQLLQPLLNCIFPFAINYCKLYSFLSNLQEYCRLNVELNVLYHFDCDGELCTKYENIERTKILFSQNIGECKVKYCAKEMEDLLFDYTSMNSNNYYNYNETVSIILPYIKEIIEDPSTSVLASWYLFDPIAKALGPVKTNETLLQSLLRLYENEQDQTDNNIAFNCKIAKLYHHSFLLILIVRLGLKTFLDYFITPLVEAVGGLKDYERSENIILHNHSQKLVKKTSHLKNIDDSTNELENLSPLDEESSADSEKINSPHEQDIVKDLDENEPEVFEFENEDNKTDLDIIQNLEHNVSKVDLDFNHSTAEEALEDNIIQSESETEFFSSSACPKSPTIPIPCSYHQTGLITIGCDVGSKHETSDYQSQKRVIEKKTEQVSEPSTSTSFSTAVAAPHPTKEEKVTKSKRNNFKISDMSSDSLIWLSHRLGPVLTARFLSRNLLRMLTLCYVGKENLEIVALADQQSSNNDNNIDSVMISNWRIIGDQNASKVLHCLVSIAGRVKIKINLL